MGSGKRHRAAVVGGSGYGGAELIRRLLIHPEVELVRVASIDLVGEPLSAGDPALEGRTDLVFEALSPAEAARGVDVVLLGLPHGVSATKVPELAALPDLKVVDMSGDFRLKDAAAYTRSYGHVHPCPELLQVFTYGLPEQNREAIRRARLVAAPGCFATTNRLPVLLGETVGEDLEQLGARVDVAVGAGVRRRVLQPEVAAHVDDLQVGERGELGDLRRGDAVRQPEQDDVDAARGLGGGERLEHEVRPTLESGVAGRERLTDEVDRRDPDELDLRVDEEAPDELRTAVPGPADDRRAVALARAHAPPLYRDGPGPASAGARAEPAGGDDAYADRRRARLARGAAGRDGGPAPRARRGELVHARSLRRRRGRVRPRGRARAARRRAGPARGRPDRRRRALRSAPCARGARRGSAGLPRRPRRHGVPGRHVRGVPARGRSRARARRLRHEGRARRDGVRPRRRRARRPPRAPPRRRARRVGRGGGLARVAASPSRA